MMGRRPRLYIPSFVEIGQPVAEKRFLKGFTIYGHDGHLDHVTWTIYTNFGSPCPRRLHIKYLALIGQVVSEKIFENGGRRQTTNGRRLDGYTKSSSCEPNGSGELIMRRMKRGLFI